MSFFSELRRRNVFRVGAAYVIVAWITMQVTDLAAPALHLPDWVPSFIVFLLLIGFPVALLLAWAYEVTPDGIRKTNEVQPGQNVNRFGGRKLDFVIIVLLAGAVLLLLIYRNNLDTLFEPAMTTKLTKISIAVLPFANMSADPNQEHFADGLTEEILNSLAALSELRVISRTSSFAFKSRNVSMTEIAASLDVDHILEGSVRRDGSTVRVTAQLIDPGSDSHLWSNTYDRDVSLASILDIQEEIAIKVVDALNLQLLPQESASLAANGPTNLEALDFFHDGMFYLRKIETGQAMSKTAFESAIKKFEASIAADPNWAPPRAALGRTYHFGQGILDDSSKAENMRLAKEHVLEAIRLDDEYGPSYGSLGYILTLAGEHAAATRALDRARSLNVNVSWEMALLMVGQGRHDMAIDEYHNAVSHDPLSTIIKFQLVEAYLCAGRYADVINAVDSDEFATSDTFSVSAKTLESEAYLRSGDVEKGLQLAVSVVDDAENTLPVAVLFALAGEEERARTILNSQKAANTLDFLSTAAATAALGERDRTLTMLERAADSATSEAWPHIVLWQIQCSPEIRNLSGNPRYEALLDRLGLPD